MARRRLLSDEMWAGHLAPPTDEREIARHYRLGADGLAKAVTKRGDANRLGYTFMLLYFRHPGRALEAGETQPDAVLAYVARQLSVPASAFRDYARRDATRRGHLVEAMRAGRRAVLAAAAIALEEALTDPTLAIFEKLLRALDKACRRLLRAGVAWYNDLFNHHPLNVPYRS